MRIRLLIFLICPFFLWANKSPINRSDYVDQYKPLAQSLSQEYGIPDSVILAVAIVESYYGKSKVARKLNNHFGFVGKNKVTWSRFKQYDNVEASYRDFCVKIATKAFYSKLKGNNNYKIWINKISKTGYSAHPKKWRAMVNKAVLVNRLER